MGIDNIIIPQKKPKAWWTNKMLLMELKSNNMQEVEAGTNDPREM